MNDLTILIVLIFVLLLVMMRLSHLKIAQGLESSVFKLEQSLADLKALRVPHTCKKCCEIIPGGQGTLYEKDFVCENCFSAINRCNKNGWEI